MSLPSVIYKLVSVAVAEILKKPLSHIISKCQTELIKDRLVSDLTRLICTQPTNSGLLMLLDFEKAFNSLSQRFLYKTLNCCGYSKLFIKWLKLFNTEHPVACKWCTFLILIDPLEEAGFKNYLPRWTHSRPTTGKKSTNCDFFSVRINFLVMKQFYQMRYHSFPF